MSFCCAPEPGCRIVGDTRGKPNDGEAYGALPWTYPGPEDIYRITKTTVGDLTARIRPFGSIDLDILLLYAPHPSALLSDGDVEFTARSLAPGTYYLIVDGFRGSAGQYELTLICASEPTPTPSPTNTPAHSYYPLLYRIPTSTPSSTPTPTATPTATETPIPTATPTYVDYEFAVNCASTDWYQSTAGLWYAPDKRYEVGSWGWSGGADGDVWPPYGEPVSPIAGTNDPAIYQRHRYGMESYRFTVPNGHYAVLLQFAETFQFIKVGQRVFAVELEGQRVMDRFDMLNVGARNRAYNETHEVDVSDGVLEISFIQQSAEFAPAINGIRVWRLY